MEYKSFTARLLPETKNVIINQIPEYVHNMKVQVKYDHNSLENKLRVDLVEEFSSTVACLVFDDTGVHIYKKFEPKLRIDIKALTSLWQSELSEVFGKEYNSYVRALKQDSTGTTV